MTDDALSQTDSTSSSLLNELRNQSRVAWDRFVELYGPLIYIWCRRFQLQPADSADVSQEVFQAVIGKIGQFRKERPDDSFRAWLFTITKNKATNHFRATKKDVQAEDQLNIAVTTTSDSSQTPPVHDVLWGVLRRIQPDFEESTWWAFWRTAVDGLRAAQVGEELGISENAVWLAKSRVLKRLRQEFGDLLD